MDKYKYFISNDLHSLFMNGYRVGGDRYVNKDHGAIYIVVFGNRVIKGENVLIYHYIKYPYIFYETLYSYIVRASSSTIMTNDMSIGTDYLFVITISFFNSK